MLADTLKLCLNGSYGNLMQEHSWLFDPKAAMVITINGQLFLTMLAERLLDVGFKIESINTDGITAFVDKNRVEEYTNICKDWEDETTLELEAGYYTKIFRRDVNCYYAQYADNQGNPLNKVKEKGAFLTEAVLGKGYDKPIISKALKNYFLTGESVETFIRNHDNIYDFCMMQKVDRKFKTMWNNKEQQRTNRFYVSNDPNKSYLFKVDRDTGKQASILKGFGVELFNKYEKKEMKDYRINYNYYISETKKILDIVESKQLSLNLFD